MPLKQARRPHHVTHKKEKRSKHFLKVYAPYIPLLVIVSTGILLVSHIGQSQNQPGSVQSYATHTTDDGLLEHTNTQRLEQGIGALALNNSLGSAAQAKAEDMAAKNYWAHNTPEGKEPWMFISATNYSYIKAAENLAYGFNNSEDTVSGWMNSPGHRANLIDANVSEVGFGIVNTPNYKGEGPQTIVVAMYAQPSAVTPALATTNTASPESISYIQSVTNGKAPWSGFILGLVIGSIIMYFVVTHARQLRNAVRAGEKFVIKHPLFDITLVALAALAVIANSSIGTIY